ncbi:MAG: GNAT family N-acetyltransferase, partial [Proteobacteria bacterium]
MTTYTVKRYQSADCATWNRFVASSKNGTFLFLREYMDYHADRFPDYSLLVFDGEKLLSILPAHLVGNKVNSHWGLTYGGFVLQSDVKLKQVVAALESVLRFLHDTGIESLSIKLIPSIYHKVPSDE